MNIGLSFRLLHRQALETRTADWPNGLVSESEFVGEGPVPGNDTFVRKAMQANDKGNQDHLRRWGRARS